MKILLVVSLFISILGQSAPLTQLTPIIKSGLEGPVYVAFEPGTNDRLYVVEQKGRILSYGPTRTAPSVVLDIENKIISGGEMGLLGLAFHPQYATNKRVFINYTIERSQLTTVVAEVGLDSRQEREILSFSQPYTNHNGGHLSFAKDGMLYISAGDGGSANDPHGNGQSKSTLLGKMLRIDVDHGSPYSIPKDNPFVGEASVRQEIYAYGLRNVWRFSFDRMTGALFAGDVGQDKWEEINVIEKGKNYGWNTMEATHCFKPSVNCNQSKLTLPILEYPHSQGVSVTGGYVYRGKKIPGLEGAYVYGDYGSGKIWALYYDQEKKIVEKNELLLSSRLPISSFGEDGDGELYVVSYTGAIYRLDPKGVR